MQACIKKKFGGIAPKKPLISKDHERAYFDSADWVLGKQGGNSNSSKVAVETLKPKLKVQERLITSSLLASQPAHQAEVRGITLQQLETSEEQGNRWTQIRV
uniref:Negatively light-regulated protein n=1 Tax=Leersia perrieri TaxID=77586 RepID=A0A0D9VT51_9ORYZ